jgi:hypothetical protein
MPEDVAGFGRMLRIRRSSFQVLGELGKKVNFVVIGAGRLSNSAHPALPRLGGRSVRRKLWGECDGGKSEQHPEQEPKIGIQQEIFI